MKYLWKHCMYRAGTSPWFRNGGGGEKRNRTMNTGKTSVEELFSLSKARIVHFWYQGPFSYNCNLYRARILYWLSVVSRVKIIGIVFFQSSILFLDESLNDALWFQVNQLAGENWMKNRRKKNDAGKGIYFFLQETSFGPVLKLSWFQYQNRIKLEPSIRLTIVLSRNVMHMCVKGHNKKAACAPEKIIFHSQQRKINCWKKFNIGNINDLNQRDIGLVWKSEF